MTHISTIHNCGGKLFWALAPVFWGALVWFLAFGPGAIVPISYPMRQLIGILVLVAYFYKTLYNTSSHNQVLLFEYQLPIPSWKFLIGITVTLLLLYRMYMQVYPWGYIPIFDSLVFVVFTSACIEELLTRSFFLKYRMTGIQFIFFNIISSLAFSIMHLGYEPTLPSLHEFILRGYFQSSFLLGLIAYKTQRIEVTMLLHMMANFFNAAFPILVLYQSVPEIFTILFICFEYLVLGGTNAITKNENKNMELPS